MESFIWKEKIFSEDASAIESIPTEVDDAVMKMTTGVEVHHLVSSFCLTANTGELGKVTSF